MQCANARTSRTTRSRNCRRSVRATHTCERARLAAGLGLRTWPTAAAVRRRLGVRAPRADPALPFPALCACVYVRMCGVERARACMHACACARARARVCVCVHACVRVCVCVCV